MKIQVLPYPIRRAGEWCWDVRHNGFYTGGRSRSKLAAYASAIWCVVSYWVSRPFKKGARSARYE